MVNPSETIQSTYMVSGLDVYYELYGQHNSIKKDSKVFVLIHGFLSSCFSFRRLIPFIAKDHTVLVIDLPPFGKSGKHLNFIYSYDNFANVVISLVNHLNLQNINLVGHSMGGQIALYVSKKKPELVNKVILLCSSGYMGKANPHLIFSSYFPFFHLYVKRTLAKQGIMNSLVSVVHNQSLIDDEMINGYKEPFLQNEIFRALTKMIRDREGDLSPTDLQDINTPALLIWGEKDKVVPLEIGKRLHQDLKQSILVTYPEAGHLIPEEIPEHIYDRISNFI
ncbi:alpha/beta fold hydrolase [Bacillus sp. EAC]|uniref:alpha/beta fold hydrolase n=1 Tax=Bacillus sp. EAC TaxID=1978338 RepID=UPI000B45065A|nr:alpha/beta hydrolase [Bacillus sp. EAC]